MIIGKLKAESKIWKYRYAAVWAKHRNSSLIRSSTFKHQKCQKDSY